MSAYLEIGFEREADLTSLRRFLSESGPDGVTAESLTATAIPDNAMTVPALQALGMTLASTGTASGALLVVREWLKTRVTKVKVSVGPDRQRAIEVTGVNVDQVLAKAETTLTRMLEEDRGHDGS
jgi:Effector Associated Constant Component 1